MSRLKRFFAAISLFNEVAKVISDGTIEPAEAWGVVRAFLRTLDVDLEPKDVALASTLDGGLIVTLRKPLVDKLTLEIDGLVSVTNFEEL